MREVAHTPGEWASSRESDNGDFAIRVPVGRHRIAIVYRRSGPDGEAEAEANARLIAAAPDQHVAAIALDGLSLVILSAVNFADKAMSERVAEALRANRAAISKATGAA